MVLEALGKNLKETFKKITKLSIVDKEHVQAIINDLQRALIQADVDVGLVFELSNKIKKRVLKAKLPPGLTLKEYFIKILYEEIVKLLGKEVGGLTLKRQRILLVGLFGSGKTTTAGKLSSWFKKRGLSVSMVACDIHRPAAQEQLIQIGKKLDIPVYYEGKNPVDIAKKAVKKSEEDVLIFDSAGRDALDERLAKELKELGKVIKPDETLLIIPADIGQSAKKQTEEFNKLVGITGIIVTKLDGTAKGGGALSAASASGSKVKFIGVGEKIEDFEIYDPERFVSRLIGYGDIKGLLERAREVEIKEEVIENIRKGRFTLNEFYEQIKSMQKMGTLSKIVELIPGFGVLKIPDNFLDIQEEKMRRWKYAIDSMTKEEREMPEIIKLSRIKRIARGSGLKQEDIRELLRYYKQIKKVFKMTKGGRAFKRGPFAKIIKQLGLNI